MPHVFLSDLTCQERRERYARVRYVFTDLDGTMMGPGSCVLKNAAGEPSLDFVSVLVELARAGIEVIPCSGRNRSMLHEDTRVLGLNSYIGEMGGLIMLDREHNEWEYFTADMPYDPADSRTPHEVIEAAGVCEEFVGRWPGMLEFHNDMSVGYKYREVTVGLRGEVDDAVAQAILDESGLPLDWVSNGYLTYISAPTTLALPEGVRGHEGTVTRTSGSMFCGSSAARKSRSLARRVLSSRLVAGTLAQSDTSGRGALADGQGTSRAGGCAPLR